MGSLLILSPQCYKLHSAELVYRAAAQTYQHFAEAGLTIAVVRHSNVPKGLGR